MQTAKDYIGDKVYSNTGNRDVLALVEGRSKLVLDVGCGAGDLAALLQQQGHVVDGISISESEIQTAKPFLRNAWLQNLEQGLPPVAPASYDAVVCSHVLEHICYPKQLLKDIHASLKEDGYLVVALPNIMHYKTRFELMGGNFKYDQQGLWDYTHFRWYTYLSAKKLLEEHGFHVAFASVSGELPLNSLFSKILPAGIRKGIYKMLTGISKGFFGYQLLYKAYKNKPGAL